MSFLEDLSRLKSVMVQTPLGRAAGVICMATEEFHAAIREGSDKDLCCSPESFELVPEPPEDEGGLGTGAFIMRCETDSNYTNMAAELQAVLAPLMLKWGVSCIEVTTVEQDSAMLDVPRGEGE
jgi:hypothetical protein